MSSPPCVAVVLPSSEGFGPEAVGAIGMLVQRLGAASGFATVVIGADRTPAPFSVPAYRAAPGPAWLPVPRSVRYAIGVADALRRLRPSLIEVHNRPLLAGKLARRFPGTPTTLFLHNDPRGMRGMRSAAERRALLGRLARVVAVSEWVRSRLAEIEATDGLAETAARLLVLRNCIDLAGLPPPRSAAERSRRILYVGRIVPEKGPDRFIAACARALPGLPGWRAEMLGARRLRALRSRAAGRESAFEAGVRRAAEGAGISLAGYRPHHEILAAMAEAAIVVVPSRWEEPFGLTALEAMASSAALICSPRGNLPALTGGAALLADPDDPDALAAAITELARDPERRGGLGAAGRQRARCFDVPAVAASLDALRRAVLDL
ncbi:MAG: glycosyltransferase family 4 protein [Acidisphaera sp.]|nr:glycosyltransferase family 4 protein [Acidisphaera sp.]